MSLFSWEWREAIDFSIEISRENIFDLFCDLNLLRKDIGQLNPIVKKVVSDPVHIRIGAFASFLLIWVLGSLLLILESALSDPVVLLPSVNLSKEPYA